MTPQPRGPMARRLAAVRTLEEMDTVLRELAANPRTRWRKSQVLHYLPPQFHEAAQPYFDGERIVAPRLLQRRQSIDAPSLEVALSKAREFEATSTEGGRGREVATPVSRDIEPPTVHSPDDVVGHILSALATEIRRVERESPKRFRLAKGRCVGTIGGQFVYIFRFSSEPELLVPGELTAGRSKVVGRIGRQGERDDEFEVHLAQYLGATVPQATFFVDPSFLLRVVFTQLDRRRDSFDPTSAVAGGLFRRPDEGSIEAWGRPARRGLNAEQEAAIAAARSSLLGYVWGPPGTGKTTTLGHLIRELADAGKRVLILSPYNIAVDEAVLAALRHGTWAPEQVVRFGRISQRVRETGVDLESLLERRAQASGLLRVARELHAAVYSHFDLSETPPPLTVRGCLDGLGAAAIALDRRGAGELIRAIQNAINVLRQAFRAPEGEIVRNAQVVGTTAALSFLSPLIQARSYDHILVDEASVVRTPEALLVALMYGGPLTFFGDPKQLPPIVRERSPETDQWLRRNPFDLAGISKPEHARGACVILTKQNRMAPPIREIVSDLFYDGILEDGVCPAVGRVLLVDTSETPATATTRWIRLSPSKENLVHRTIVSSMLEALRRAHPAASILVLSPFLAQRRAYEKEAITARIPNVRFATVHASQGTESDIVIMDLVVAPGRGRSRFLNDLATPELPNLLNVAMSRAREQLIFVAHWQHLEEAYAACLIRRIVATVAERHGRIVVPASLRLKGVWKHHDSTP